MAKEEKQSTTSYVLELMDEYIKKPRKAKKKDETDEDED